MPKIKTKPEQYYQVNKVSRRASLETKRETDSETVSGILYTAAGLAYAESNRWVRTSKGKTTETCYTTIRFIHDGKEHYLYDEKFRSERSLASLGYAFVKAVSNGERL